MKKISFTIPMFYFDVTLLQVESKDDSKQVEKACISFGMESEDIDSVKDNVECDCEDGGDTFRNFRFKKLLVIFYRMSSSKMRENIWAHEKRHIEDRILQFLNIDDIETSAILAGYLGEQFNNFRSML